MAAQPPTDRKPLTASTVAVSSLAPGLIDDAFALFDETYAGADRARFEADLADKQLVIVLRDRAAGRLQGFSTVRIDRGRGPRGATVVYSGDTAIRREYWGQKLLQREFARILLSRKVRAPRRPLYWFLLSKGYRTYMLLANAFPRAVPRCDRPADPELRATLDRLASERFGGHYDPTTGVVRFAGLRERVRDGLAPVTERHLANRHVRFFVERNPRWAAGDELACLAEVRLVDLARIGGRIVAARWRLGRRRRPGRAMAVGAPRTGRSA